MHPLVQKYSSYSDTRDVDEDVLAEDFDVAQAAIAAHGTGPGIGPLTVVRDWIGQRRRCRIHGIGDKLTA